MKKGDVFYCNWIVDNGRYFEGIVEVLKLKKQSDTFILCKILKTFKTDNNLLCVGWDFYLTTEQLNKKINEKEYPEYFI